MEVLVGPTFAIDVSSSPAAYVRDRGPVPAQDKHAVAPCLFLKDEGLGSGIGICGTQKAPQEEDSSGSSSSIGVPDDSDEDDASSKGDGEGDEVQSKFRGVGLGSLDSLEESLPIKSAVRIGGLSNHFSGKSKSFANLSEVCTVNVKEVEKSENPFNKRRRVLIASKWSRKSSFYSWPNPKSMPLLALNEDDEEQEAQSSLEDDKQEDDDVHDHHYHENMDLLNCMKPGG
ncbi:hypothetical protein FNV43_RR11690 [Rhamnella rubrinervis]|uniref:Uncharacterized protein n=1 Tax=Rhamnella rubrinervis TaxID=2594499 RepID=A0A8K0MHV2_9ROSA|nr:hypothetical protein FNV43_RR11690 [Rhamnella rubrinervis]